MDQEVISSNFACLLIYIALTFSLSIVVVYVFFIVCLCVCVHVETSDEVFRGIYINGMCDCNICIKRIVKYCRKSIIDSTYEYVFIAQCYTKYLYDASSSKGKKQQFSIFLRFEYDKKNAIDSYVGFFFALILRCFCHFKRINTVDWHTAMCGISTHTHTHTTGTVRFSQITLVIVQ